MEIRGRGRAEGLFGGWGAYDRRRKRGPNAFKGILAHRAVAEALGRESMTLAETLRD